MGKEGQGLKAREYHTKREATVETVLRASMVSAAHFCATPAVNARYIPKLVVAVGGDCSGSAFPCLQRIGAVMVTGPPQSGKTSLLQLLHEAAKGSELFSDVYYVDMEENNGDLEQGLAQHKVSWRDLYDGRAGMPKHACPGFRLQCAVCCSADSCCGMACRLRSL